MRFTIATATGLALSITLSAQDKFEIFPSRDSTAVTFVTRGSFAGQAGELTQEISRNWMRGAGRNSTANCEFAGFEFQTQDQNQATAESYTLVFRSEATGGGPDITVAGEIFRSGTLTVGGTGTGAAAFIVTGSFATPLTLPCDQTYFLGVDLAANALWATDGQSMSMAGYRFPAPFAAPNDLDVFQGDWPRSDALANGPSINHSWQVFGTPRAASRTAAGRTMRIGLRTREACALLNMGNLDTDFSATVPTAHRVSTAGQVDISYGFGGIYPECVPTNPYVRLATAPPNATSQPYNRRDGIMARVIDTQNIGGNAFLFLGVGFSATAITLPGSGGALYLDPAGPILLAASAPITGTGTPAVGIAQMAVAPMGSLNASFKGVTLTWQALSVDSSLATIKFSNATATIF